MRWEAKAGESTGSLRATGIVVETTLTSTSWKENRLQKLFSDPLREIFHQGWGVHGQGHEVLCGVKAKEFCLCVGYTTNQVLLR